MIIKPHFPGIYGLLDSLRQKWGTFRSPPTPGLHSTAGCGNTHSGFLDSPEIHHLHVQSSPGWRATMFSCPLSPPSLDKGSHLLFPCPHSHSPLRPLLMTCTFYLTRKLQTGRLALRLDSTPPHFPAPEPVHWPPFCAPGRAPFPLAGQLSPTHFSRSLPPLCPASSIFLSTGSFPSAYKWAIIFLIRTKTQTKTRFDPIFPPATSLFLVSATLLKLMLLSNLLSSIHSTSHPTMPLQSPCQGHRWPPHC